MRRSTRIKEKNEGKPPTPSRNNSSQQTSEIKPDKDLNSIPLVEGIKKTSRNLKNNILVPTISGEKRNLPSSVCESTISSLKNIGWDTNVEIKKETSSDLTDSDASAVDFNMVMGIVSAPIKEKNEGKPPTTSRNNSSQQTSEIKPQKYLSSIPLLERIKKTSRNLKNNILVPTIGGEKRDLPSSVCKSTISSLKNIRQDTNVEINKGTGSDLTDSDASAVDFNMVMGIVNFVESKEENIDLPKRKAKRKSCGKLRGMNDTSNVETSSVLKSDVVSAPNIEQVSGESTKIDNHTTNSDNVEVELSFVDKPLKEIVYKPLKVTSFGLDRSKYENLGLNKFACNPLMQTLTELKKSFPFNDHVRVNGSREKNNTHCSKYDILSLDSMALANKTPANKNDLSQLSSQLQTPVEPELYFDMSASKSGKTDMDKKVENLMKKSVLLDDLEKMEKSPKLFVSKNSIRVQSERKQDETAGKGWYNLPKTVVTDKIKNDLHLVKMRNVLDSKHHYKRNDSNKLPKYFQMGTIVEGAHEFYSARVPKNKRKRTMVDELLDDAEFRRKNKKKYIEIRKKQMSGGKGFYKKLKNKSKEAWERT